MKNLYVRTISGLVFAAIMIGAILHGAVSYIMLMAFIIAVMNYEFIAITSGKNFTIMKFLTVFTSVSIFTVSAIRHAAGYPLEIMLIPLIPMFFIYISMLYERKHEAYGDLMAMITSIAYTALPFTLTNLIAFGDDGSYNGILILSMFIILWGSDVGAYLFGMSLGQKFGKKLFPSISPKKSWIGFAGGLVTAAVAGIVLQKAGWIETGMADAVIISVIINIFGVFGDLAESQLKRNFGVKDSGKIMPGHGGLLDRFDGALIGFPMAVIYIETVLEHMP